MADSKNAGAEIIRLTDIMAKLRDPDSGCPWDIEQDFASIAPNTIEEAHEVSDAIDRKAWDELPGELGDLLLQVVFHAQMAQEQDMFDFADCAAAISDKLIFRHPHVFGDESRDKSAEQQVKDWEARVGFDWPEAANVLDKITEETAELVEARDHLGPDELEEEFGDLLFVMANLARHLKIDPEQALRRANTKFTRRFQSIEAALSSDNRRPEDSDLAEMDRLWNQAKLAEKAAD